MASIFKRKRNRPIPEGAELTTDRKGKPVAKWRDSRGRLQSAPLNDAGDKIVTEDAKYSIVYVDRGGKRRLVAGTTDYKATEAVANSLDGKQFLRKQGIIDATAEATAEHGRKPITEHAADYINVLGSRDVTAKHVSHVEKHLNEIISVCELRALSELNDTRVAKLVDVLKDDRGRSARTINSYLVSLRGFVRWLVRDGRLNVYTRLGLLDLHGAAERLPDLDTPTNLASAVASARGPQGGAAGHNMPQATDRGTGGEACVIAG